MKVGDKVRVIGPISAPIQRKDGTVLPPAPPSKQLGKWGTLRSVAGDRAEIQMDDEDRYRNFRLTDLQVEAV